MTSIFPDRSPIAGEGIRGEWRDEEPSITLMNALVSREMSRSWTNDNLFGKQSILVDVAIRLREDFDEDSILHMSGAYRMGIRALDACIAVFGENRDALAVSAVMYSYAPFNDELSALLALPDETYSHDVVCHYLRLFRDAFTDGDWRQYLWVTTLIQQENIVCGFNDLSSFSTLSAIWGESAEHSLVAILPLLDAGLSLDTITSINEQGIDNSLIDSLLSERI